MNEAHQFVSANDRVDFFADIMASSAQASTATHSSSVDPPAAVEHESIRFSWLDMAGLFSFTSRRVQSLRSLEGLMAVERQWSDVPRQGSGLSSVVNEDRHSEGTSADVLDSSRGAANVSSEVSYCLLLFVIFLLFVVVCARSIFMRGA